MVTDPFEKLSILYKRYENDQDRQWLGAVEKSLKRSLARKDLTENHIGFKDLLELLHNRITMIDKDLASPRNLKEDERSYISNQLTMFALKESYEWFIALFTAAESNIKEIESTIDENITDAN